VETQKSLGRASPGLFFVKNQKGDPAGTKIRYTIERMGGNKKQNTAARTKAMPGGHPPGGWKQAKVP